MPDPDIRRLIAPRSIALIGAGAWTDAVAAGSEAIGFGGTLWRVHPRRSSTPSAVYYRSVDDLPGAPDAAFLAVPNHEAPAVAAALARRGGGGFVCFSSGFSETGTDLGRALTHSLLESAGALPFFGPNCYGFVNFFDRVALWPDQVVGTPPERGVALICQSGTIALTLMFNDRSLPIGYLFTVGNQTRLAVEDLIELLADDPRVTAFGLYLEGIKNPHGFARAAARARAAGKPIAVVKSGRTAAAERTAHSHTGALTGADAVFDAFCRQAGLARCDTLGALCETLKVFHVGGPLRGRKLLVMGASGGDMAMTADVARDLDLDFAPFPAPQTAKLRALLGDRVTVANPFDMHTYLWFDPKALRKVFDAVLHSGYDAVGFMLDCPPDHAADTAAFDAAIEEFIAAAAAAPSRAALIASLPETMGARIRRLCLQGHVVPLQGQREALQACAAASAVGEAWGNGTGPRLHLPRPRGAPAARIRNLSEYEGKAALATFGVPTPRGALTTPSAAAAAAAALGFPVVLKAVGAHLTHKTEVGGVALNLRSEGEVAAAALRLAAVSQSLLVEEMISDGVAELLVGMIVDAQFGQVLVLGSGGVFTELLADTVNLLPPWTAASIENGIRRLRAARQLGGFRGQPAGDIGALLAAVQGVARFASAHRDDCVEIDVNPLIVRPAGCGALAVDAVIRLHEE
ncbi:MAG TPA: acetate--CoA ligase family protein [Steroidobacteraceae bacterium]|nr:acetate--CoA ligase family protein [Steroidobacteraceae bacterium]